MNPKFAMLGPLLMFSFAAGAQSGVSDSVAHQDVLPVTTDRSGGGVSAFLQARARHQSERAKALASAGLSNEFREALACVQELAGSLPTPDAGGRAQGSQRAALTKSFHQDVAYYVALSGRAGGKACQDQGLSQAVVAAGRAVRGEATIADLAALSDTIVVGTGSGNADAAAADGFGSTARFEVSEVLRGSVTPGSPIGIRQASGTRKDGSRVSYSSDVTAVEGRRYVLLLSARGYKAQAFERGQASAAAYINVGGVYELDGDRLLPASGVVPASPATLSSLKSSIAGGTP